MDRGAWNRFKAARERFRLAVADLEQKLPKLKGLQQKLVDSRAGENSSYTIETSVVYNSALDDVTNSGEIKLILVGDNPGRREQAAENRRYLVGPSGKIAENFFRANPAMGIDFRKNVIILNKTPVHTPRTIELRELCRLGGKPLAEALDESQKTMAALLLEFQRALNVPAWIVGYSEMKKGGIFEVYTETLKNLYDMETRKQLFFFRHFSMNQFTIDLKKQSLPGEPVAKTLNRTGAAYRERILG